MSQSILTSQLVYVAGSASSVVCRIAPPHGRTLSKLGDVGVVDRVSQKTQSSGPRARIQGARLDFDLVAGRVTITASSPRSRARLLLVSSMSCSGLARDRRVLGGGSRNRARFLVPLSHGASLLLVSARNRENRALLRCRILGDSYIIDSVLQVGWAREEDEDAARNALGIDDAGGYGGPFWTLADSTHACGSR